MLVEKLGSLPTDRYAKVQSSAVDVVKVVSGPNHLVSALLLLRCLAQACASLGLVINRHKTWAMAFRHHHLPEPFEINETPAPWATGHDDRLEASLWAVYRLLSGESKKANQHHGGERPAGRATASSEISMSRQ